MANGGTPVIDFRIYYDQADGNYILIKTAYANLHFTIDTLTPGRIYGFKVLARNKFGLSEFSDEYSILCATVPDVPLAPETSAVGS